MNVTFNTCNKRNYNYNRNQSFTANAADAATIAVKQGTKAKSKLFKPFDDAYDKFTDKMAKDFTSKIVDSTPMNWLANKLKSSGNLFQHCLTVGSLITSGLYMEKTLTNDKLEKDRKRTLAVNQGLTFLVSTIGAYSLDKSLKSWWENITAKYVGLQLQDKDFEKDFRGLKNGVKHVNEALKKTPDADITKLAQSAKDALKLSDTSSTMLDRAVSKAVDNSEGAIKSISSPALNKYIDKLVKDKKMPKISQGLSNRIKGMGLLRTMLVFGFVYRYFVPVVVTKPANLLCEKYLAHKKAKADREKQEDIREAKQEKAEDIKEAKEEAAEKSQKKNDD